MSTPPPIHGRRRGDRRRRAATHERTARNIARGAYEDVIGPHAQTHRGDPNA